MSVTPQSTQDDDQRIVPSKVEALTGADAISRGFAEAGIDRVTLLEKIKELHADVDGSVLECWRKNLPKMILLGEALTTLQRDVEPGKWLEWCRANAGYCGFGEDTAERYMRLYRNRELLEQPGSAHVRNLTDALILIKEPDPDKRKALLDEAARTGKSIRSAKKRAQNGQKPLSDPKRTAAIDGLIVLGIEYEVAAQWAEAAQGETVEDLIKDALRRRALALEIPKDSQAVQDREEYLIQTPEGVTVYFTEDDHYKIDYNLEGRGEPVWMAKQPQTLRMVEEDLGVQCPWVLAPEPPNEPQEASSDDSDDSSPNEPPVTVEPSERFKDTRTYTSVSVYGAVVSAAPSRCNRSRAENRPPLAGTPLANRRKPIGRWTSTYIASKPLRAE
jgi:hypothetical protein